MYRNPKTQPTHPIGKKRINRAGIANINERRKTKLWTKEEPGEIKSKKHSDRYAKPNKRLMKNIECFLSSSIISPNRKESFIPQHTYLL